MTRRLRIHFDALALDENGSVTFGGERFNGTAFETFSDGRLESELDYVDGQIEGMVTRWGPSGHVKEVAQWWHGARHGRTVSYDDEGGLLMEQDFEYGVLVSERQYGPAGELVSERRITPGDDLAEVLRLSRTKYGHPPPRESR